MFFWIVVLTLLFSGPKLGWSQGIDNSSAGFETVSAALRRFHSNPKLFMSEPAPKILRKSAGSVNLGLTPANYWYEASPKKILENKIDQRCNCVAGYQSFLRSALAKAGWDQNNRPEKFLKSAAVLNRLEVMEQMGLQSAELAETPWSGDYFAMAQGGLGRRGFDPDFSRLYEWVKRFDFIQSHPFLSIFTQGGEEQRHQLAVSEKYDLLLGDQKGRLTDYAWGQGRAYYDATGEVEEWMGICHGWAPASYLTPRPLHSIQVPSFEADKLLKFNPSELKGLVSQQWSANPVASRFLGQRCESKSPKEDENGRVVEDGCFDLNPGTWHLVIVNRLGKEKKSFVFDATYDYQVWNQPVYGYSYTYFNPLTEETADSLADASIAREQYLKDPFAKYRDSRTKKIVGIAMDVNYIVETSINTSETDDANFDLVVSTRYMYDLELDENGVVIGGEWYGNQHPDFIWTPEDREIAASPVDAQIRALNWNTKESTPTLWRRAAEVTSPRGLILGPVVEGLIKKARTN